MTTMLPQGEEKFAGRPTDVRSHRAQVRPHESLDYTRHGSALAPTGLDTIGVGEEDIVLDIACGTGDLAELSRARGARVIGLDFAAEMLRAAQARGIGRPFHSRRRGAATPSGSQRERHHVRLRDAQFRRSRSRPARNGPRTRARWPPHGARGVRAENTILRACHATLLQTDRTAARRPFLRSTRLCVPTSLSFLPTLRSEILRAVRGSRIQGSAAHQAAYAVPHK